MLSLAQGENNLKTFRKSCRVWLEIFLVIFLLFVKCLKLIHRSAFRFVFFDERLCVFARVDGRRVELTRASYLKLRWCRVCYTTGCNYSRRRLQLFRICRHIVNSCCKEIELKTQTDGGADDLPMWESPDCTASYMGLEKSLDLLFSVSRL